MSDRKLLFSVTAKDCRFDYYKGSGSGGQKRNKTENCARCTHLDSGAVATSEDGRSKDHNKKNAFVKMTQTETFQKWLKIETARKTGALAQIEESVNRQMHPDNIRTEVKSDEGTWIEAKEVKDDTN